MCSDILRYPCRHSPSREPRFLGNPHTWGAHRDGRMFPKHGCMPCTGLSFCIPSRAPRALVVQSVLGLYLMCWGEILPSTGVRQHQSSFTILHHLNRGDVPTWNLWVLFKEHQQVVLKNTDLQLWPVPEPAKMLCSEQDVLLISMYKIGTILNSKLYLFSKILSS